MKLFLTTAVLAAALSTSAFAQGVDSNEKRSAPSGQVTSTTTSQESGSAKSGSVPGAAMKPSTMGAGSEPKKDPPAQQGETGTKTGVGGNNK